MSALPPILKDLLNRKDSQGIKDYLEGLKATEKGLAFEQFLEELYQGNGYIAKMQGGRGDLGADILLYDSNGEDISCIIQAKNHSSPLSFDDTRIELTKFETMSSKEHRCKEFKIIAINGYVARTSELTRFRLSLDDWSDVEKLIESHDFHQRSKPNIQLHSHNQTTFDAAIGSLKAGRRVACVQATGTGKSYVIAKTMNEFSDEKKLVIAPSRHILEQQDSKVGWLRGRTKYMTYSGAARLKEPQIKELDYGLIVLDEFHRAGAEGWGSAIDRILENCPDAKVLGTTATPKRYLDGERDMSAELFDEEAVNLPLAEAIQRNILPAPEYVASLYTLSEEVDHRLDNLSKSALSEDEKKKVRAELEQAKIDWEKTSGVPQILKKYLTKNLTNKFIVFCRNKEHLDELEDEVRKWIRKTKLYEDRETYRVYSDYRKSDANFKAFKNAKDKTTAHILLCIDKLNEGIHAPDVGAVLLFRPTASPRIFYQQIGRCLQVGTKSKPIIFDLVNNFKSIKAANPFIDDLKQAGKKEKKLRENFGLSADYLPEIHVHDESRAILETFQEIDDRLGSWEINFQKLVAYKEEHGDCLVSSVGEYKQLAGWVSKQRDKKKQQSADRIKRLDDIGFIWDVLTHAWELQFRNLVSYQEKHGDCLVSRNYQDKQLAQWVVTQRETKKNGEISNERIKRLDNLGFSWNPDQEAWEDQFQKLKSYKKEHGDCLVPQAWRDKQLGSWVTTQRLKKNKGKLGETKIALLDDMGFVWDTKKHLWDLQIQKLVAYKEEHGDCLVGSSWSDKKLVRWVKNLRDSKKKGSLDSTKIRELDGIGFNWNPQNYDEAWETQFQKLKEFQTQYGHCRVPTSWDDRLNRWILTNRQSKKKGKLSTERLDRLEQLGFIWEAHQQTWETQFEKLLAYKKEHGDCLVPAKWVTDKTLANWVTAQRTNKKKGTLSADKIKRLDEIGFVWDATK
ncbi:Helicase associated domain protein [Akkermansiaceae bacterium]|nr:Helicase associated domain protein [Akkermansiaceae bacterium]